MKTVGLVLGIIVAGLAAYIIYGMVTGGGVAYASTTGAGSTGSGNVLTRTAGSNAQTPQAGTFRAWNPSTAGSLSTGIVGIVEKITGSKVLGFSNTKSMSK